MEGKIREKNASNGMTPETIVGGPIESAVFSIKGTQFQWKDVQKSFPAENFQGQIWEKQRGKLF